jgi:hypothetical protein
MYIDQNGVCQDVSVVSVQPLKEYKLLCELSTGEKILYDFTPQLKQPMFHHLIDIEKFNDVIIIDGAPTWISAKTGHRTLDMGISWIVEYGIKVE